MITRILGHKISREFIKFSIVGVVNTLIHLAVLYMLVEFFGVWYVLGSFIAFLVAVTNSFVINTVWTFRADIRYKTKRRYGKFFVVSSVAAVLNLFFLYLFTEWVGLWYMFSQVLAIGFTLMINFLGNKVWTYCD